MNQLAFTNWAPKAPMGWNSWDCFGASVTEAEVKANADYLAKHLKSSGYNYVVVDIQWYEPNADSHAYHQFTDLTMDAQGRLLPALSRFPSAAGQQGFKPLAAYVHSLGLKFGIHTMRGIPRQAVSRNLKTAGGYRARDIAANNICAWNSDMYGLDMQQPGAQDYYDSVFQQYADWGVDFVKVDDIGDSVLYGMHKSEIAAIRQAIDKTGRKIVLSLSPGPADINEGAFLQQNANMWRVTDDFWDDWQLLKAMFPIAGKWAPFVGHGTWPDCDMLPLGRLRVREGQNLTSKFTKAESLTMLSLWSLVQAPLMLGGDLTHSGEEISWVTSKALLAMRQDLQKARQTQLTENQAVWLGQGQANDYWGYFNLADTPQTVTAGLSGRSIWTNKAYAQGAKVTLPAHAPLVIVQPQQTE